MSALAQEDEKKKTSDNNNNNNINDTPTPDGIPFDYEIHVASPIPSDSQKKIESELLQKIEQLQTWLNIEDHLIAKEKSSNGENGVDFVKKRVKSDLQRTLRARKFDVNKSLKLAETNLKYLLEDKPFLITPGQIEKEALTGKTRIGGFDRHGRPVVVLDNTVENTNDPVEQMRFLMFNMELSIKSMISPVEKHVVFIHLENFSLFNAPSISVTKKTIEILASHYCERLGRCILWQPPAYFTVFLAAVSYVIDPITRGKLVMIRGDYSEGTDNDKLMKSLIGGKWKEIVGVDQPKFGDTCSPGYNHEVYWKNIEINEKIVVS